MSETYSFTVNGVVRETEEDKPLLRYLRDDLRLTSCKDGCSEGACGTCTILVDGRALRACILTTRKAAGKNILTVEGLTVAEKEAFVYAFGKVGAVQCGFCIPGMVISGKALLDQNPSPTEADIKKAIRGNVCRCTGYKKIIEGISLAGAILRGEAQIDPDLEKGDVAATVADLVGRRLMTREQAEAVDRGAIERFLASPLARRLRQADRVEREARFSLLVPAGEYYPDLGEEDEVLLQGVVDLYAVKDGQITVVDFKTDRITEKTLPEKAAYYRPQLEAYSQALEKILGMPVAERILYFFHTGQAVSSAGES